MKRDRGETSHGGHGGCLIWAFWAKIFELSPVSHSLVHSLGTTPDSAKSRRSVPLCLPESSKPNRFAYCRPPRPPPAKHRPCLFARYIASCAKCKSRPQCGISMARSDQPGINARAVYQRTDGSIVFE